MATRGCTSRAASREPQVLRVLCLVILGTSALTIGRSKLRSKLRGSTGVPRRVVKTNPVSIHASPACSWSADWPFMAQFQRYTNDIVYRRLAPGVLEELKRVQIRDDEGRPKHKLFQRLTANTGYPKLQEHLGSVVTIMKLSRDWADFRDKLDRIHPRYGEMMRLPFDEEADTGKGF